MMQEAAELVSLLPGLTAYVLQEAPELLSQWTNSHSLNTASCRTATESVDKY